MLQKPFGQLSGGGTGWPLEITVMLSCRVLRWPLLSGHCPAAQLQSSEGLNAHKDTEQLWKCSRHFQGCFPSRPLWCPQCLLSLEMMHWALQSFELSHNLGGCDLWPPGSWAITGSQCFTGRTAQMSCQSPSSPWMMALGCGLALGSSGTQWPLRDPSNLRLAIILLKNTGLLGALLNCSPWKQRTFHFGVRTNMSDTEVYMAYFSECSSPVSGFPCLHSSTLLIKVRTYKLLLLCLSFWMLFSTAK